MVVGRTGALRDLIKEMTGFDIMKDDSTFKDIYEIMLGIGKVWDKLSDIDRTYLIEKIAGKNQANVIASVLQNADLLEKAYQTSVNSAGSAQQEQTHWAESMQYSLNQLQGALESLAHTLMDSGALKSFIDFLTEIVKLVDSLSEKLGKLAIPAGILSIVTLFKRKEVFAGARNLLSGISKLSSFASSFSKVSDKIDKSTDIASTVGSALETTSDVLDSAALLKEADDVVDATEAAGKAAAEAGKTAATGATGFKAFATTVKSAASSVAAFAAANPAIAIAIGAVTAAVAIGTTLFIKHQKDVENLRKQYQEVTQTYKEQQTSIDDTVKKYGELRQALIDAKGDEAATADVKQQLLDLQVQLNDQYGSAVGKINLVTDAYRDQTDAIKSLNDENARKYLRDNSEAIGQAEKDYYKNHRYQFDLKGDDATRKQVLDAAHNNGFTLSTPSVGSPYMWVEGGVAESRKAIQGLISDLNELQKISPNDNIEKMIGNLDEQLARVDERYNQSYDTVYETQKAKLQLDKESNTLYEEATKAVDDYNKALVDSNNIYKDPAVDNAIKKVKDLRNAMSTGKWATTGATGYNEVVEKLYSGFNTNFNEAEFNYAKKLQSGMRATMASSLSSLTTTDLSALVNSDFSDELNKQSAVFKNLIADAEKYGVSAESLISILSQLGYTHKTALEEASDSYTQAQTSVESYIKTAGAITAAQTELDSAGVLSTDTTNALKEAYGSLDGLLTTTSRGYQLNTKKLEELNKAQEETARSNIRSALDETAQKYNNNQFQLNALQQQLANTSASETDLRDSIQDKITALTTEQSALESSINGLRNYQAELNYTSSAYTKFIQALSTEDASSEYDKITSSLDTIKKQRQEGKVGTDQYRRFIQLMSSEDVSGKSKSELGGMWDVAYKKAKRYFTETNKGSLNLLDDLTKFGAASKDANGQWTINIEDMSKTASDLGISTSALEVSLNRLNDFDFEIEWTNTDDQIIDIKNNYDQLISKQQELDALLAKDPNNTFYQKQKQEIDEAIAKLNEQYTAIQRIQEINASVQRVLQNSGGNVSGAVQEGIDKSKATMEELAKNAGITVDVALQADVTQLKTEVENAKKDGKGSADLTATIAGDTAQLQQDIDSVINKTYTIKLTPELQSLGNSITEFFKNRVFKMLTTTSPSTSTPKAANPSDATRKGNQAFGSANAFYNGKSWGVGYSGKALVGELGTEMLVRNGQAYPIGQNGAEYIQVQPDDIIFNHLQTEQLQRTGHTNSRGTAFAQGSIAAFPQGSATGSGGGGISSASSNPGGNYLKEGYEYQKKAAKDAEKASKKAKKAKEEEQKTEMDWITRRNDWINKQREQIVELIEDSSTPYKEQIEYIKQCMELDQGRADFSRRAAETYREAWEKAAAAIPQDAADLISGQGDLRLDEYDQDTAQKIEKAKSLYDNYIKYAEQDEDIQKEIAKQKKQILEIMTSIVKAQEDQVKAQADLLTARADLIEAKGGVLTEAYYREQIALSQKLQGTYQDEIESLQDQLELEEEGSEEYYNLQSQITQAKQAIIECEAQQEEWNYQILRLPIERIKKYLDMLDDIKTDLNNFISEQSALGKSATLDQYEELLKLSNEEIKTLTDQQKKLKDLLGNYRYGSTRFEEIAGEIQDVDDKISSVIQQQYEWNAAILNIPIEKIANINEQLQLYSDTIADAISDYDDALTGVNSLLDDQIDKINDLKDATEKEYKAKIDPLQDELDLLQKQNEARQIQISLEQAKYNLEKAQKQKTNQVIRNGEIVYEADQDEIRNANQELQDAQYNKITHDLQTQIDDLEEKRDKILEGYDEQIEKLEDIKEKWSDITEEIQRAVDIQKATDILGSGWQDKVLTGNDQSLRDQFSKDYEKLYNQQQQIDKQIESNERISSMMQHFVEQFQSGAITYQQAMDGIKQLQQAQQNGYTALEQLNGLMNLDGIKNLTDIAGSVQKDMNESLSMFGDYFTKVNDNLAAMDSYVKTWDEMKKNIAEQVEALKKAAEALEKYQSGGSSGGGGGGGSSSSGKKHNGPNVNDKTYVVGPGPGNDTPEKRAQAKADGYKFVDSNGNKVDPDKAKYYKSGLENGFVGSDSVSNTQKSIQTIALRKLEPDEFPVIAHLGEAILNQQQQKNVIDNFSTALAAARNATINSARRQTPNVTVSMGDIILPDVTDANGFAKAVKNTFAPTMRQYFSKM